MLFGNKERYIVRTLGDSVLRAKAAVIPAVTPEIRALAERMIRATRVFDGIGLAAPQIGESLRLVVIEIPQDAMEKDPTPGEVLLYPKMPLVLINPQIVERSTELAERDEGCLSLPEIYAPVVRPARVVLDSDILDGVVFSDRVAPDERKLIASDLRRLEKYGAKHNFQRVITA